MIYLAFFRAINVGGKGIVSMKRLKETFEELGFTDVRTYINSGNVIFTTRRADPGRLAHKIEAEIRKRVRASTSVLVLTQAAVKNVVDAIPTDWGNDARTRCYVFLLWKPVDHPRVLEELPRNPEIEELKYVPGAVLWRIDRRQITRSRMTKIVGTRLYKQMTSRNSTTIRKLVELVSGLSD